MSSLRKDSAEEDEYWGGSKVKSQRVNLFDDNVTVETAEGLAKSKKLLLEDEDVDLVNWDGSSVSLATETAKNRSTSYLSKHASTPHPTLVATQSGPPKSSLPSYMTHTRSQSHTFGMSGGSISVQPSSGTISYSKSTEKINPPSISSASVRSNITLEDEVEDTKYKGGNDPVKMTEHIEMLQRSLQRSKEKPPIEDTIKYIINGMPYNLEVYRSLDDKLALLDQAIKVHDGNAITAVILFLKRTVKAKLFNLELQRRPSAVNHYINFLQQDYNFRELADLLGMLNRHEEAAMLRYRQAIASYDVSGKISCLKGCLKAHFMNEPSLSHESQMVKEHISILERQRPIEDSDSAYEKEGRNTVFREHPRARSIINMPVITTLYYCCFYHPELPENNLASPLAIKNEHSLTDKQFTWTALSAYSRLKRWNALEQLLSTKGWFGGTKAKSVIGFDRVCEVLYKTSAPLDILSKYLRLVENSEKRIVLAKRFKCHDIVIDTYKSMRDRAEIENYAKKLQPGSREMYYAQDALKSSTIKWKT